MKLRTATLIMLALMSFAAHAIAAPSDASQASKHTETIHGIPIVSGMKRRQYISIGGVGIRLSCGACIEKTQGIIPQKQDCAEAEPV